MLHLRWGGTSITWPDETTDAEVEVRVTFWKDKGKARPIVVSLPAEAARAVIAVAERFGVGADDEYVFHSVRYGRRKQLPHRTVWRAWAELRTAAELPEKVRIHDLRHQFITEAASGGLSTAEIMQITGHRTLAALSRYLHAQDDTVRANTAKSG